MEESWGEDTTDPYVKSSNRLEISHVNKQINSHLTPYNTCDYNSSPHLVPYPQSILEINSNSFNCPNCSSLENEYTGPITYDIFMKQQQKLTKCYCTLHNNNASLSSDLIDDDSPIFITEQEPMVNSSKTPLISSSSPAWSISLNGILKNISQIEEKVDNPVYTCSYEGCPKTFSKVSRCRHHKGLHADIKPYICTWPNCKWKFTRSDELTRHYRTHTGDKPFSCKLCARTFARSDHLGLHMKTHLPKKTKSKESKNN